MNHLSEKLFNISTYGIAAAGISANFENVKSVILFVGGITLLGLQIYLHIIKIRKEKKGK